MPAYERPLAKPRPVYLDLLRIRQPVPAVVSVLHRISGALLLVFGIPVVLASVNASLASPESFASLQQTLAHPLAKLVAIALIWALLHHLLAGIRHLLLDLHKGIDLEPARRSSWVVLVLAIALTLIFAARLW